LQGRLYRRNISWARYRNHVEIARSFAEGSAGKVAPDLIFVSMPTIELAEAAVVHGRSRNVPVIIDVRDLWPDEIYARIPRPLRVIGRLALAGMERSLRTAVTGAHSLCAISERYLEWALARAGRSRSERDRVFTFGYPDPLAAPPTAEGADACKDLLAAIGRRRVVWFAGTFVGSIDLSTVIGAARLLGRRSDLVFVLTGSGEREAEWRQLARGLPNVLFTGWLNRRELDACARSAWVGLGAYKRDALMSLTNKIFEYLAYGLPILISLPGEARDIIESAGAGIYYQPGSAESLARAVEALADAPAEHERMAANARDLFERRFSASVVYNEMADYLLAIGSERARP
jgi:glycosyltransferase involved in cell wall biosynthesis